MKLPAPRGPLSEALLDALAHGRAEAALPAVSGVADVFADEDLQLSLYVAYELHYRGFEDVPAEMEWDPAVLGLRAQGERVFADALEEFVTRRSGLAPDEVPGLLFELAREDDGPGLARHLGGSGTPEQFREFAIHRSAYQLKEADPHSWAIPRLDGAAKAALVEVQFDEYGSGRAERIHARLFADAMDALGLDSSYGAYLDRLPALTLANVNLMSLFGLHRRWLGAIVGHLAMFEITSPEPNRRYANGLRRLGLDAATEFFDEHVEADAVHENIAAHDMAGSLAEASPELATDILFGAEALLFLESRWAGDLLDAWEAGGSSLREPEPEAVGTAA
ncbi:MAG: iron-containing redox enzyme family protein [Solirubrobacterales bacterium]